MFPDGRIIEVDLTKGSIEKITMPADTYRLYPGGSALGVYLLLNRIKPRVDALSPENVLAMTVSPLTGFPISGISRLNITAKSPLTGAIGDSQSGGFFPAHFKANGWDGVVFKGRSDKPVYLYIDGENIELRDASALWGKVTGEAEALIKQELGNEKLQILQIGPGGENLVRYACVLSMCTRANGRNGMGAVMGSKNLKAVVLKNAKAPIPAERERFMALAKSVTKRLEENESIAGLGKYGTSGDVEGFHSDGFLPTKNWLTGYFPEGAENITGTTMYDTVLKERDTCFACAVRCKRVVEIPGKVDPLYGGPEYETCATLGSYCGVTELEAVCIANQLCNMYGLDTMSCGATISFAMECYEKGMLEDADGLELNFGNAEAMLALIEKIAYRRGIGDMLAEGSKIAAARIGGGADELSIAVKGQELPAHMPQFKPAVGLIYAVNPFGADHQSSEHDPFLITPPDSRERIRLNQLGLWKGYEDSFTMDSEKVRFAVETQRFFSILDTLCLCQFVWGPSWELYGPDDIVELCKAALGWETSIMELMLVGERRINMMRYFNQREGFSKADDRLPERVFQKFTDGPSEGLALNRDDFEFAKALYYQLAGWDAETGNPKEETLVNLSLGWMTAAESLV